MLVPEPVIAELLDIGRRNILFQDAKEVDKSITQRFRNIGI